MSELPYEWLFRERDNLLGKLQEAMEENKRLISILEMADFSSLWVGDREMRIRHVGFGKWVVVDDDARYLDHGGVWSPLPDGFEMGSEEIYSGWHFAAPIAAWDAMDAASEAPDISPTIGAAASLGDSLGSGS